MALSCIEVCIVLAIKHKLRYLEFRLLAEWLDCYNPIMPANRMLLKELPKILLPSATTSTEYYIAWELADIISTNCTIENQRNILWKLTPLIQD